MFTSSSRRPSVRRPHPRAERPELRLLSQAIEENRALADRSQRDVARGRGAVVDIQARVLEFRERGVKDLDIGTGEERHQRLAALVEHVDAIHQRLLMLSASIELEVDRLDVTRIEIDQLTRCR